MNPTIRVPGRLLAWVALVVALGASVAANVGAARPDLGPRLSSAVAPVLALFAAGLLERVPLASARRWQRWLAWLGLGTVGAAAFITSFDHQRALLLSYGNTDTAAWLLPVAVDGLILMSTVSLTVIGERRRALAGSASDDVRGDITGQAPAETSADTAPEAEPVSDTEPDMATDTVPDTATDTAQPKQRVRRAPRKATTAERVAAAKRRTPTATAADIAKRLRVTTRTVERHLAALTVADIEAAGEDDTDGGPASVPLVDGGAVVKVPAGPVGERRGERVWREGNAARDVFEAATGQPAGRVSWVTSEKVDA